MIPLRVRLPAIAIVAAMLATLVPLFANDPHRACVPTQHDCGQSAQLKAYCCLAQCDRADDSTPAVPKAPIAPPVADGMAVVNSALPGLPDLIDHGRPLATPQRSSPPDLITLFGTFLI